MSANVGGLTGGLADVSPNSTASFVPAIAVQPAIGYDAAAHLAPAVLGTLVYLAGMALTFRPMNARVGAGPRRLPGPSVTCPRAGVSALS
jgi:hypothetical protein